MEKDEILSRHFHQGPIAPCANNDCFRSKRRRAFIGLDPRRRYRSEFPSALSVFVLNDQCQKSLKKKKIRVHPPLKLISCHIRIWITQKDCRRAVQNSRSVIVSGTVIHLQRDLCCVIRKEADHRSQIRLCPVQLRRIHLRYTDAIVPAVYKSILRPEEISQAIK